MPSQDVPSQDVAFDRAIDVPEPCRAELIKLMTGFVDSELSSASGFSEVIALGPSLKEAMALARIVHEKIRAADTVCTILGTFETDMGRYELPHPWSARIGRDDDIGCARCGGDRRLAVFHYPLDGWTDTVVMHHLLGSAVCIQLEEYSNMSFRPLADAFGAIRIDELRHAMLAREGVTRALARGEREAVQQSVTYWWPRVAHCFGKERSAKYRALRRMGLRHRPNEMLRKTWEQEMRAFLDRAHLSAPMVV
ncbi:MAG: phenylacetic acid catabolic [Rhodobacteraceae bacterium]|nr:phenylacetic acid catabolic [Paracoccaceae bacterium]MAY43776.1 phenylacetic acid catabolic [Paracoccaceae bacterium]